MTSRPSSALSEVTPASEMPHGTKRAYQERSTSQLRAKPCIVTPRLTRMPRAAILRSGPFWSARSHTPLRPGHPRGLDPEVATDADQGLLHPAYVVDHLDVVREPDDRVADQLAGAVEGDQAAAVDVDHGSTTGVGRAIAGRGALAGGEDGRVLEQPDGVGDLAGRDPGVDLALCVPGGEVVDGVLAVPALAEDQIAHAPDDIPDDNAAPTKAS